MREADAREAAERLMALVTAQPAATTDERRQTAATPPATVTFAKASTKLWPTR